MTDRAQAALTLLVVASIAIYAPVAEGNTFDLYGFGSRNAALGGARAAAVDDFTATYYNVANLAFAEPSMGAGFLFATEHLSIRLKDRPGGYDLPDTGRNSPRIPSSYRLEPRHDGGGLPDVYGLFLGASAKLGDTGLAFGFGAYLPLTGLGVQRSHFADETEQYFSNTLHFELLGDPAQGQVVLVGAAYQVLPSLSLGAGLSFLPQIDGATGVYVDNPTDQSRVDLSFDQKQTGRIAPHAGLAFHPTSDLHFGLAYRGALWLSLSGQNELQIRGFQQQDPFPVVQRYEMALNYRPHQLVLGGSYDAGALHYAVDATYALWSRYLDNQGRRADNFDDTLSLRTGVEVELAEWIDLRFGGTFEPSPVPDQLGRTNYVDNRRVSLSAGTGHDVKLLGADLRLAWHAEFTILVPRDTNKAAVDAYPACEEGVDELVCDEIPDSTIDPATGATVPEYQGLQTGNPGFPGFASWGEMVAVSAQVGWLF